MQNRGLSNENTNSVHSLTLICIYRLALGALQVATTPPMYPGHLPTCWASSAWYEPATGARSKSATQRTASPRVASAWPGPAQLEGQTTLSFFFHLDFQTTHAQPVAWNICVSGEEYFEGVYCTLEMYLVACVKGSLSNNLMYDALTYYSSTRTQILPKKSSKMQNLERKTIVLGSLSGFINNSWANWLDLIFLDRPSVWHPVDFCCCWPTWEQCTPCTTIICNCMCCFAASLTPAAEGCVIIMYCIDYPACIHWHSISIWF